MLSEFNMRRPPAMSARGTLLGDLSCCLVPTTTRAISATMGKCEPTEGRVLLCDREDDEVKFGLRNGQSLSRWRRAALLGCCFSRALTRNSSRRPPWRAATRWTAARLMDRLILLKKLHGKVRKS